ncbi:Hypothetical protein Cp262_1379 [Corynebacterium pseudotuberculosis]|uniref:hypothetical protein n=1 Tax=Corynebacterium pseudotuberculosis TaxID=1719 RepID=UPI00065E0B6A|nr:hypothetical protein [Corynebacterium pseudotuberculosis]AKP09042.1 Hypothetical protein Cp262_1379 [Corynebacterium pseudotuberculosis]
MFDHQKPLPVVRVSSSNPPKTRHPIKRPLAVLLTCFLAGSTLIACGNEKSSDTPPVERAIGLEVDAPKITVLNSGKSDKRIYEYQDLESAHDASQKIAVKISDGFHQEARKQGTFNPTAPSGGEVHYLSSPVQAVVDNENDTRSVSVTFADPQYDDLEAAKDINTTKGFRLGWFAKKSGQISSINIAAPVDATDTGRAIAEPFLFKLASLPVVFPTEEIGEGAVWTVDSRVKGESALLQTMRFTLVQAHGDSVVLDVDVQQRPVLGALEQNGTTLEVLSAHTTSTGRLTVDLKNPLPIGTLALTTRVVYGHQNSDLRIIQDSTSALEFSPAP